MTRTAAQCYTARLAEPSGMEAIQSEFLDAVDARSQAVRDLVEATVAENDALHLEPAADLAEERESFPRLDDESLTTRFMEWFRGVLEDELLEPTDPDDVEAGDHWTAEYIRRTYLEAWQQAGGRLRADGASASRMTAEAVIQLPVAKQQLRDLYRRAYQNLDDVTEAMAQTIREELTEGLDAGENPEEMARRLAGEIEDITRTRLRTLARTEVIHSHTTSTLDRYEETGVDTVQHGEWADADDDRVCPICSYLDGNEYSIPEFRSGTFQFAAEEQEDVPDYLGGKYPLAPPAHPNCRCTIMPVIT